MAAGRPGRRWGVGFGLGAGLAGAVLVALRLRARGRERQPLPDIISPAIFARRVQQTSRGQMVYHVSGSGDPLVFLHDLFPGAASYEWSKVYPHFAGTHRVLAPDWLGFGESERPRRLLRAGDYAHSLYEFCRAVCGGKRPVLVAGGVGASLACYAAAQHPEFAQRLVLFEPAGTAARVRGWMAPPVRLLCRLRPVRRAVYRGLSQPRAIERWLQGRRSPGAAFDLGEPVSVFSTFARQYGADHAVQRMMTRRLHVDLLERLPEVFVPVTLLWPETEPLDARLAAAFGGAQAARRLTRLAGCGPLAPLDRPLEMIEALEAELLHPLRLAEG